MKTTDPTKTISMTYVPTAGYIPAKVVDKTIVRETKTQVVVSVDGREVSFSKSTKRPVGTVRGSHGWYTGWMISE